MEKILDSTTAKAIKQCVLGLTIHEITSEYVLDDQSGDMKLIKQKKVEKNLPPNADIIKLLYQKTEEKIDYEKFTDEQLEQEKQRLLKQLKEGNSAGRTSKNKSEM